MRATDAITPLESQDAGSVAVLLPLPIHALYDYLVPDDIEVAPGSYVVVPLGGRDVLGVVWGDALGDVAPEKMKPILAVKPAPPLSDTMRGFIDWVARYTVNTPGAVLRMVLRVTEALDPPRPRIAYRLAGEPPERMTFARHRVIELLREGPPREAGDIAREAGVGTSVVKGLVAAGTLQVVELPATSRVAAPDPDVAGPVLSPDQAAAARTLVAQVQAGGFVTTLLEGVTGSGKTEVYFEAIAEALRHDRQVLVLLPEIALSAQFLRRFAERFGAEPLVWHSDVPRKKRRDAWRAVADGTARVVVGARSALFLPFAKLGLIVVDEEHDGSFKQEDGVCYNARDMAVVRASLEDFPVVLCSATPSMETLVNVELGRYQRLALAQRHGGAELPEVQAVDLRIDAPERGRWLSPPLVAALDAAMAAGEQGLLFLNRRGYAPLTLCRTCGHRFACPNCSAWLVEHRHFGRLQCHHCGFAGPVPEACPSCAAADSLVACGPGVERLIEEVMLRFPDCRAEIMSSDTLTGPEAAQELIARFEAREVDLLIGTQVAAKGHHFPMLTVVGVVDADLGLEGGDLRAMERTWQLLHQVAGRAGRAEHPGRVLLQSYDPDNPVIAALVSGDRDRFLGYLKEQRRAAGMPPFGRLAGIVVSGTREADVRQLARDLARHAPRGDGLVTMGPAPAPLSLLRGRYRWRLLVHARRDVNIQGAIKAWLAPVKLRGSLRLQIDIDPYSFL
jgi:primosomal protein N' (replication factor Y) (superfamily II helicase)